MIHSMLQSIKTQNKTKQKAMSSHNIRNQQRGRPILLVGLIGGMVLAWLPSSANSFVMPPSKAPTIQQQGTSYHQKHHKLFSTSAKDTVDELLEQIREEADQDDQKNNKQETIQKLIDKLPSSSSPPSTADSSQDVDFDSLIGYYNVSYTLTSRPKDNPVGGKWTRNQRLWKIKRTLQHILPPTNSNFVAQAINVIRLDCLWGLLPIWIMLRGDAVPLAQDCEAKNEKTTSKKTATSLLPNLSSRAVRAYFDAPRIALGKKLVFSLGPTSSVVLDTPYVDDRVRIGMGGTSGTKFVFTRVTDKEAADDWKWLLNVEKKSFITKNKASWVLAMVAVLSSIGWWRVSTIAVTTNIVSKWVTAASTILSILGFVWIRLSTGGIETSGDTYTPGK